MGRESSANVISSLRVPGMSEKLAEDVGLWAALDVKLGGLHEDVGKQIADDPGPSRVETGVPVDVGDGPVVIKAVEVASPQLAPHSHATMRSLANSSHEVPLNVPADTAPDELDDAASWAAAAFRRLYQQESVGMCGPRQGVSEQEGNSLEMEGALAESASVKESAAPEMTSAHKTLSEAEGSNSLVGPFYTDLGDFARSLDQRINTQHQHVDESTLNLKTDTGKCEENDDMKIDEATPIGDKPKKKTYTIKTSSCKSQSIIKDSSSKLLVPRRDAPLVKKFVRGSLTKALASGTVERRAQTLEKLKSDEVAASGRGPRKSRWATWCRLHRNWMPEVPVLPLTMESIAAVMSQLKEGDYSAAADYMSTAKAMHLREYEWSSRLARQHSVCVRSALRGMAPGNQCEEIPLSDFTRGAYAVAGRKDVPVGFQFTAVLAFFLPFARDRIKHNAILIRYGGL